MASFTRRFRILKHLLAAVEHQNAAMQLMLEDPDLDGPAPESPVERTERRRQFTERPTVMHSAFDSTTALAELERAHAAARTTTQRLHVAEMAERLVAAGLLDEDAIRKFK